MIRRLFTMVGTRLEAAMVSAGNGQAPDLTADQARQHCRDLMLAAQELSTLSEAIELLADRC